MGHIFVTGLQLLQLLQQIFWNACAGLEVSDKAQGQSGTSWKRYGSPIKNGHDALQSLEAIDMLPATPTFLVTSHVTREPSC